MNNKKIENENIYSYSILESEYELIKGTKTEENGIIKITDPQINSQDCEYSIIINLSEENEKFVHGFGSIELHHDVCTMYC